MNISEFLPIPASCCGPRLRHILLHGGYASWSDGKHMRILHHIPSLHRPPKRLPWPLSIVQPHLIEFLIYDVAQCEIAQMTIAQMTRPPIHEHIYKKNEIYTAINEFLRGAEPDDPVIIRDR